MGIKENTSHLYVDTVVYHACPHSTTRYERIHNIGHFTGQHIYDKPNVVVIACQRTHVSGEASLVWMSVCVVNSRPSRKNEFFAAQNRRLQIYCNEDFVRQGWRRVPHHI